MNTHPTRTCDRWDRWNVLGPDDRARAGESRRELDELAATEAAVVHVDDAARVASDCTDQKHRSADDTDHGSVTRGEGLYLGAGIRQSIPQRLQLRARGADRPDCHTALSQAARELDDMGLHPTHARAVREQHHRAEDLGRRAPACHATAPFPPATRSRTETRRE